MAGSTTKDHYIAQVFLKSFADNLGKVYVYDKQGYSVGPQEKFPSEICFERGGSENPYFENRRIIEDYLLEIENGWKDAVRCFSHEADSDVRDRNLYLNSKWIISGYLAFLRLIPPAAVQAGTGLLESRLLEIYENLKASGGLPPPPPGFENLADQARPIVTDKKYPQAMGVQALHSVRSLYFNAPWMAVQSKSQEAFLTSDYPVSIWRAPSLAGPFAFLALSSYLGVLVDGRPGSQGLNEYDHSLDGFGIAQSGFVSEVNELTIKCAERYVVAQEKSNDSLHRVKKWRNWRHRYQPSNPSTKTNDVFRDGWGPVETRP